jgi:hypothetical protein
MPEIIGNRIHIPRSTGHEYSEIRTITIDVSKGITALYGKIENSDAWEIKTYLFDTERWTMEEALKWVHEHDRKGEEDLSQSESTVGDEINARDDHQENEVEFCVTQELTSLDTKEYRIFDVIVMRLGFGKNSHEIDGEVHQEYHGEPFAESIIPLLEGSPVQSVKATLQKNSKKDNPPRVQELINWLEKHKHPPAVVNQILQTGLTGNAIGFLKNIYRQGDEIRGHLHLATDSNEGQHVQGLLKLAMQEGIRVGLSINYRAIPQRIIHQGRKALEYIKATKLLSTEIVPRPGAYGRIVSVVQGEEIMPDIDVNTKGKEQEILDGQPPVAPQMPSETTPQEIQGVQVQQVQELVGEPLKTTQAVMPVIEIDEQRPNEDYQVVQSQLSTHDQSIEDMRRQMNIQNDVLRTMQAAQEATQLRASLTQSVTQAEIPQVVKDKLIVGIQDGTVATQAQIDGLIQMATIALESVQTTQQQSVPIMPGLARVSSQVIRDPAAINNVRSKLLWDIPLSQTEQELQTQYGIVPFRGIKHEYMHLTGDEQLAWSYSPEYFSQAIGVTQATITTGSYPAFLQNTLTQTMAILWDTMNKDYLKAVKIGDNFSDTRDEDVLVVSQQPEVPEVAENAAYQDLGGVNVDTVVSSARKYGGLIPITEDTILNDRTGFVKDRTTMAVIALNTTFAHAVWNLAIGFGTAFNNEDLGDATESGSPNGVLYSTARKNFVNGTAADANDVKDVVDLMFTQEDYALAGEDPQPLMLSPGVALCDVTKRGFVKGRLKGEFEPNREDNFPNTLSLDIADENIIGLHPLYLAGHPEALVLLPDPRLFPGIVIRYFNGQRRPSLVWEGNNSPRIGFVFSNDRMTLKLKMRVRIDRNYKKAFFCVYTP